MAPDVYGLYARYGVTLPKQVNGSGWARVRCFVPWHDDRHSSAGVHVRTGGFACHACGSKGGALDAIELLGRVDRDEAYRIAREYDVEGLTRAPRTLPGVHHQAPPAATVPRATQTVRQPAASVDWSNLTREQGRIRRYVYLDAKGEPVGRVVRIDYPSGGKRIFAERHLGGNRFAPGLDGTPLPLYRLPEVLARAKEGKRVLVVEGEKCVTWLDQLGAFATTNPGGAGKWRDEFTEALRGASVTVIADCDDEGRKHALRVTLALLDGDVSVSMPYDPEPVRTDGYDVADYLDELAATERGTHPEYSRWRVRWELLGHVNREVRRCLPATVEALHDRLERLERPSQPLIYCERCQRERPHHVAAGLAYCPCGATRIPA